MTEHLDPGAPVLPETALADRIDREKPVVVLYYADWCPFCQAFMPVFRQALDSIELPTAAANLSHPEDPRWETRRVETIPTLVVYEDGKERTRLEATAGKGIDEDELDAFITDLGV